MIPTLLGALVFFTAATAAESYFLIGRAQRLLTHAEQLNGAAEILLARVPGNTGAPEHPPTVPAEKVLIEQWTAPTAAEKEWRARFGLTVDREEQR